LELPALAALLRQAAEALDPPPPPTAPPPRPELSAAPARRHGIDRRAIDLAAMPGDDDDLLSSMQTANWLSVSQQWLEIGRSRGWGPAFIRLSPRRVRYRRGTVRQYLIERAASSTAEYNTKNKDGTPVGRKQGSRLVDGKVVEPGEGSP
jgi:hypothetical protein